MRKFALALAAALGAAASSPSLADAVFLPGNSPQPGEETIVFGDQGPAATISGTSSTNSANVLTLTGTTSTGNQFTVTSGDIFPSSGLITSLTITPSSPLTVLILNTGILPGAPTNGTLTYTLTMSDSTVDTFSMNLGNGINFLTITTVGGEAIESLALSDPTGFSKLESVHAVFQGGSVPEPATWAMMLLGFGALGIGMRRRRRAALA
jgi:hypothetical protein